MERPQLLPPPQPRSLGSGLTIINPITRRGHGPGLIVLVDDASQGCSINNGVPSPFQKWGEEGYTVVEAIAAACKPGVIATAIDALRQADTPNKIGIVSYSADLWKLVEAQVSQSPEIVGAVVYGSVTATIPVLMHIAGKAETVRSHAKTVYDYPDQQPMFASPSSPQFNYAAEAVSHTRNLTHLKKLMDGPWFDLEAYWDEHTYYEFEVRDVEATMATMVEEPYVNHIPTLTGGIGRKALTDFYTNHFVFSNPKDTALELISRTVGIDRVVDEFVFKFTHDVAVDWLFPGVPPTGKYVQIPFMAVVNIRGDRLYHEHITWDQATALRQIGLLPESLPYHHSDSMSNNTVNGMSYLVLPVAGSDTAAKLRDKNAVPSNQLFEHAGVKHGVVRV